MNNLGALPLMAAGLIIFLTSDVALPYESDGDCKDGAISQFTFSWPVDDQCESQPRGGTSKGADVLLATEPRKEWLSLQSSGLSKLERDRRAILAMQGGYKVNFDFLETVGFSSDYQRDRPYQSWGTEYVYVIENEPNFISLQHVMVMFFKGDDGSISAPMVMKHWRQDWTYEDQTLLEYSHDNTWNKRTVSKPSVAGKWSQAVFQVDDSPRYESFGEWQHNGSFSSWISQTTRRPLPRREYSVRQDYTVLEGFNRHTITRHGWVQEEENWKLKLTEEGQPQQVEPYLAKEEGMARYQVLKDFDFSKGDEYMAKTSFVWEEVRARWQAIVDSSESVTLKKQADGKAMFMPLFALAHEFSQGQLGKQQAKQKVDQILSDYLLER